MAWLLMSLRKSELTQSINSLDYEIMKLSRQRQKLASFMTAIGSGTFITPSTIGSLSCDLFNSALDFMEASTYAANEVANAQCDEYESVFQKVTQQEYYNNPALAAQAELYFDENGNLDRDTMYSKFYEQALKSYVEKYVEPQIKEQEDDIDAQKQDLETQKELQKAELDAINNAISEEISNSAIKL